MYPFQFSAREKRHGGIVSGASGGRCVSTTTLRSSDDRDERLAERGRPANHGLAAVGYRARIVIFGIYFTRSHFRIET